MRSFSTSQNPILKLLSTVDIASWSGELALVFQVAGKKKASPEQADQSDGKVMQVPEQVDQSNKKLKQAPEHDKKETAGDETAKEQSSSFLTVAVILPVARIRMLRSLRKIRLMRTMRVRMTVQKKSLTPVLSLL